ncbi:MAG: formimidoylglutamase [Gammaproteobacteria bacterium]|nr:formimidoylglutamase [Gammaproteobacteria bacterium]
MSSWTGRVDAADGELGRRWHQVVRPVAAADGKGVALLGFGCDAGVRRNHGRPGAADGPRELRRALGNLAWHGGDVARLYDAGDVVCEGDALEVAQQDYATRLAALLRARHLPIGLGGGHEIAWAAYQGAELSLAGDPRLDRLGIINFDAHLDLRRPETAGRGTSGTPFLQIAEARAAAGREFRYLCIGASPASNTEALLRRAAALGTEIIYDVDAAEREAEDRLRRFVEESSAIYLTFCLDVLPPAVAPGVSAPSGLGLALHRAIGLLRGVLAACLHGTASSKLLLADVAELNPAHDVAGRTARTAARIIYEIAAFSR